MTANPLSEGDVNVSAARAEWRASLSERARTAVDEDERYFLRQSLSTPAHEIVRARARGSPTSRGSAFSISTATASSARPRHPRVVEAIRARWRPALLHAPLFNRLRLRSPVG